MKVGFLFGAGAEMGYGMPSGGKFALDIFREDTESSKNQIKELRSSINKSSSYATNWLPEEFDTKKIHAFGEKVYESIIKDTVGNNRQRIIDKINHFDEVAKSSVEVINNKLDINLERMIEEDLDKELSEINLKHRLQYSDFFNSGNNLFENNYFAVLLEYYKTFEFSSESEKKELGEIIKAIFQLQLGAMSEDLSRKMEDNIFKKDELELDIFDDLGGSIKVNYESAGVRGLELLSKEKPHENFHGIIEFSYEIIERIYSDVLDYKSLIDTNWHYLYNPKMEWAKFCRISVFLYTVREYILKQADSIDQEVSGYYDDLKNSNIEASVIGTTNYNSFIENKLDKEVIFLNGGVDEFYNPYKNTMGKADELNADEKYFIVPLLFTQSGTKPMTSIDMAKKYVNFYNSLSSSDVICSIGFGFNHDDEHINGIFRKLIDEDKKILYIVDIDSEFSEEKKRRDYAKKIKIENKNNIKFITVNKQTRKIDNELWTDYLTKMLENN